MKDTNSSSAVDSTEMESVSEDDASSTMYGYYDDYERLMEAFFLPVAQYYIVLFLRICIFLFIAFVLQSTYLLTPFFVNF